MIKLESIHKLAAYIIIYVISNITIKNNPLNSNILKKR